MSRRSSQFITRSGEIFSNDLLQGFGNRLGQLPQGQPVGADQTIHICAQTAGGRRNAMGGCQGLRGAITGAGGPEGLERGVPAEFFYLRSIRLRLVLLFVMSFLLGA